MRLVKCLNNNWTSSKLFIGKIYIVQYKNGYYYVETIEGGWGTDRFSIVKQEINNIDKILYE